MSEHDKLVEVTRNADEIQTTFIGFVMGGRVIEVGDINHKPNLDNTRRIVTAVNNHERLVEALRLMLKEFNEETIGGIVHDEKAAISKARYTLAQLEAGKGGEL